MTLLDLMSDMYIVLLVLLTYLAIAVLPCISEMNFSLHSSKENKKLAELSSKFFSLIPHDFGRKNPPILNCSDAIIRKKRTMMTLSDIELTHNLQPAQVCCFFCIPATAK